MDEFFPTESYHPEDEYEPIDSPVAESEPLAPMPVTQDEGNTTEKPQSEPISTGFQPIVTPTSAPLPSQPVTPEPHPNGMPLYPPHPMPPQDLYYHAPPQPYYRPAPQYPVPGYQMPMQSYAPPEPQGVPQQMYIQPPQGAYVTPEQATYTRPQPVPPATQPTPIPQAPQASSQMPVPPSPVIPENPYTDSINRPYRPAQPAQPVDKPRTPTGTKVFLIILSALLLAMLIGFIVYVANAADQNRSHNGNDNSGFNISDDDYDGFYDDDYLYPSTYTEVEEEITLVADNGDTQQRDDDHPDSVGKPDENADGITLKALPKDKDDEKYTTQSAYESVCDSVVTVVCYQDEITDNVYDIASQGSGTVISADGYIITNAHVIGNSKMFAVNIVMNSGDEYQAKIIGYDTWTDLALLKIDAKDLRAVTFGDSDLINIGDDVIAIGSPGGAKYQNSLTKGIISAVDREISINKYVRYIQSDAAISPGNSGGPMCNIYGQVIGITSAKTTAAYYENMSFSIPSDTVKEIVNDLLHYGYVKGRVRIGITGAAITEEEIYYYGTPAGVLISEIAEDGSLANSDIKVNDIITSLDGVEITSFQDIYDVLADHQAGDKVTVTVARPD